MNGMVLAPFTSPSWGKGLTEGAHPVRPMCSCSVCVPNHVLAYSTIVVSWLLAPYPADPTGRWETQCLEQGVGPLRWRVVELAAFPRATSGRLDESTVGGGAFGITLAGAAIAVATVTVLIGGSETAAAG